jgi:hypothetical protein
VPHASLISFSLSSQSNKFVCQPSTFWWDIPIIKLLFMQVSPFCCVIYLLEPNTFNRNLFPSTVSLCSAVSKTRSPIATHKNNETSAIIGFDLLLICSCYCMKPQGLKPLSLKWKLKT